MDLPSSQERKPLLSRSGLNNAGSYQIPVSATNISSSPHDNQDARSFLIERLDDSVQYLPSSSNRSIFRYLDINTYASKDKVKTTILLMVTLISMLLLFYVSISQSQAQSGAFNDILHSSTALKLSIQKQFVSKDTFKYKVYRAGDRPTQVLAQGLYQRSSTTWNQLDVQVTDLFAEMKDRDDMLDQYFVTMEAVGFLEGFASCLDINHYYVNFYSGLFDGGDPTPETVNFLEENYEWMSNMAEREWRHSSYWLNTKALLAQLNGLLHGVQAGCPGVEPHLLPAYLPSLHKNPSLIHLLLLNANGDLYQIAAKFDQPDAGPSTADDDVYSYGYSPDIPENFTAPIDLKATGPSAVGNEQAHVVHSFVHPSVQRLHHAQKLIKKSRVIPTTSDSSQGPRDLSAASEQNHSEGGHQKRLSRRPNKRGSHCSVLIKLTHDYSDLLYGHDTWDDFQCMGPRIFKRYYLPVLTFRGDNGTVPQQDTKVNGVSRSRVITQPEVSGVDAGNKGVFNQYFVDNEANEPSIAVGEPSSSFSSGTSNTKSASANSGSGSSNQNTKSMGRDEKLAHVDVTFMDMRFSSSPGYLTSIDDFFVLAGRANLAVLETSEDMIDETVLEKITAGTLLSWARTRLANQLAVSGPHWADVFAVRHSGTYTNQWMVIDLDRFTPGKKPRANSGLLTVLEELPGYIHWEDLTHILADSLYWASFNNAYYKDVRALSGADMACAQDASYCYDSDPRFVLFRQMEHSVDDLAGLQKILGYNRYRTDLVSQNDSCATIACRSDLQPLAANQYPFGATDSKVSSAKHSAVRLLSTSHSTESYTPKIWAKYGPTHDDVPVFCWSKFDSRHNVRDRRFSHLGQPECFDGGWNTMPNPGDL